MGKVDATRGWRWLTQAAALVAGNAAVFASMGLIVAGIYMIPLLGGLLMLMLGPGLIGGSIIAARDADNHVRPRVGQLFALFLGSGRSGEALKLCIPLAVGRILAGLVIAAGMTRIVLRAGLDLKTLADQPELLVKTLQGSAGDLFGWLLAALLIMLVAWAFSVSAIARVALDRAEPFAAMAESFRLARRNAGAWLLAGFALFVGILVVTMPILLFRDLWLLQTLINVLLYSLLGPLLYFAWRDLCVSGPDSEDPQTPESASASASASASEGTLEA